MRVVRFSCWAVLDLGHLLQLLSNTHLPCTVMSAFSRMPHELGESLVGRPYCICSRHNLALLWRKISSHSPLFLQSLDPVVLIFPIFGPTKAYFILPISSSTAAFPQYPFNMMSFGGPVHLSFTAFQGFVIVLGSQLKGTFIAMVILSLIRMAMLGA